MTTIPGWYLVGFLPDLTEGINPVQLGGLALMAVRKGDDVAVYDARCPHRGANLGYGGTLDRDCVVCPFHGKRIRLGAPDRRLGVARHYSMIAGDALFVRIGDQPSDDRGFELAVKEIAARYRIVPAVEMAVSVPPEYIVENAFDVDHFQAVHKVPRVRDMHVDSGPEGELTVRAEFVTAQAPWQAQAALAAGGAATRRTAETVIERRNSFHAKAYSPHVVVTDFSDGDSSSVIITGAQPLADGTTVARVAVAVPDGHPQVLAGLVAGARKALAEDVLVWEHLDTSAPQRLDSRDTAVLAFQQFCSGFAAGSVGAAAGTDAGESGDSPAGPAGPGCGCGSGSSCGTADPADPGLLR